nr:hypothetical protein Iba_chr01dCG7910 [Ipomoea batatas]
MESRRNFHLGFSIQVFFNTSPHDTSANFSSLSLELENRLEEGKRQMYWGTVITSNHHRNIIHHGSDGNAYSRFLFDIPFPHKLPHPRNSIPPLHSSMHFKNIIHKTTAEIPCHYSTPGNYVSCTQSVEQMAGNGELATPRVKTDKRIMVDNMAFRGLIGYNQKGMYDFSKFEVLIVC